MKTLVRLLIAGFATVVVLQFTPSRSSSSLEYRVPGAGVEKAAAQESEQSKGPPPLVVDKSAPLLLDDPLVELVMFWPSWLLL